MIALRLPASLARVFQVLAVLCGLAAFAWVSAHWIWRAAEPAAVVVLAQQETEWSARILSGGALGFTRVDPTVMQQPISPDVVEGRIRLMGIAREPGDRGRFGAQALFKVDSKRVLWLRVGEELEPGIVLVSVDADAVRIARDGKEVRLPLRERAPPPVRAASAAGASIAAKGRAPAAAAAACKLAPDQRARAYILRPEIVDGVMRERSGWSDLFKSATDGLQVQNPGGTGAMLGLYGDDILSKADGAQLSRSDDVLRLILQPLARNDSVIVTGSRGGQPREWIYAGMSCLPR